MKEMFEKAAGSKKESLLEIKKETWRIGGGWDETLVPGKLDRAAKEVYSYGQCAYLALAIYERTGGQIWAIIRPDGHLGEEGQARPKKIFDSVRGDFYEHLIPDHFGVEVDKKILDIHGSKTKEQWENRHNGCAVTVTPLEMRIWQKNHQRTMVWMDKEVSSFNEDSLRLARVFADTLLAKRAEGVESEVS